MGSFLEHGEVFVDLELVTQMQLRKPIVEEQRDLTSAICRTSTRTVSLMRRSSMNPMLHSSDLNLLQKKFGIKQAVECFDL
jgi:hypothetical protein